MAFMQSCSFLGKKKLSRPKPLRTPLAWFISYQLSYNLRAHLLRMDQLVSIHHPPSRYHHILHKAAFCSSMIGPALGNRCFYVMIGPTKLGFSAPSGRGLFTPSDGKTGLPLLHSSHSSVLERAWGTQSGLPLLQGSHSDAPCFVSSLLFILCSSWLYVCHFW